MTEESQERKALRALIISLKDFASRADAASDINNCGMTYRLHEDILQAITAAEKALGEKHDG